MPTKSFGTNINVTGWALVSDTAQRDGSFEIVLRGDVDKLDDAMAYAATLPNDEIRVEKDPASGVATITVTGTADSKPDDAGEDEEKNDPNLSEPPEVTLAGAMAAVPIYQAPYFGLGEEGGDGITVQDAQTVETLIRDQGTVYQAQCSGDKMSDLASWKLIGQETFLKPTYTLQIVFHIRSDKRAQAADYITTAGTILTWAQALANVPSARRPPQPDGFAQWLACAPTIIQTQTGCDVTVSYIGAKAFPNYYTGGTWTPPPLEQNAPQPPQEE